MRPLLPLLALALAFIGGMLVYRNNAKKAAHLESKAKSVANVVKG